MKRHNNEEKRCKLKACCTIKMLFGVLLGVAIFFVWRHNRDAADELHEAESAMDGFDDYY